MMKLAIVEDEARYAETLKSYLKRYETENGEHFQIQVFSDGLDIITDYTASYDIILLDIQMKHLNGMKTAQKIREFDEDVIFIFITSSTQSFLKRPWNEQKRKRKLITSMWWWTAAPCESAWIRFLIWKASSISF